VDDFESYTDYDQSVEAVWQTWIDGLALNVPDNGSQVGYLTPTYVEQTIVHGGTQSMPYFYNNGSGYSEATTTLIYPRDWTVYGVDLPNVDKLSIGFGDKHNPQAGGSGLVFFDDIRLYRPTEP